MSLTFEAFKQSFSYGARNDLNFKFLKYLSDDDAADWFQELLYRIGDSLDNGDLDRLWEHVFEGQATVYAAVGSWTYDDGPFTKLEKPTSETRVTLISSSGHFVAGRDPQPFGVKDMTQEQAVARIGEFLRAVPELSAIPFDTPPENLRVRHGGYDVRAAAADPSVVLPLRELTRLQREGVIGELTANAYSFMGATSQKRLLNEIGPQWVEMLKEERVEAALLVPA